MSDPGRTARGGGDSPLPPPPRYFPVRESPLRMTPGMARFGTDSGGGAADRSFFQFDVLKDQYLRAKRAAPRERRFVVGEDTQARTVRECALEWMERTLLEEHPDAFASMEADQGSEDGFDRLARAVQEDFAVLHEGAGGRGRTLVLDVRFPSGWHPERLREADFEEIHAPVPGFPAVPAVATGLVRAMVERGPWVRFVWSLVPDDSLDHHPERVDRQAEWQEAGGLYLRVERQTSVPLPSVRGSIFLIRTYLYPVAELTEAERGTLQRALEVMPPELREYKNLPGPEVMRRGPGLAMGG